MLRARERGVKTPNGVRLRARCPPRGDRPETPAGTTRTSTGAVPVVRLAALIVLLVLPCATLRAQDDACDDPAAPAITALRFEGNRAFPSSDLASRIATTRMSSWASVPLLGRAVTRRCLDGEMLRLDALRLLYAYRVRGFADAEVEPRVEARGTSAVAVVFRIREGAPLVLTSFRVTGLEGVPDAAQYLRDLPAREGGRFDELAVAASRDSLLRRLRNAGYPRADVFRSFSTDRVAKTADARLAVVPGPLTRIGAVSVSIEPALGREPQVAPDAVRGLLGIRTGDIYREQALVEGQRRAYQTEAFRAVQVDLDSSGTDSLVTLRVRVAEQPMRAASVGAGWGTIDCFRAQGTLTNYNFLGGVRRLDLTGRLSRLGVGAPAAFGGGARSLCAPDAYRDQYGDTLNYYLGATLRQPQLFGFSALPELTVYTEQRSEYNAYRRVTPVGLNAALGGLRVLQQPVTLAYTLELGRTVASPALFCVVFTLCNEADRAIASEQRRFAAITASTQFTRQNDPVFPTRGATLRLEGRHVSRLVGADPSFRFNRVIGELSGFTKLGTEGVLTARLRAGGLFDVEALQTSATTFIPVQERLFAGGPSTVRGFRPNELGPKSYRILAYDSTRGAAIPGQARDVPVPVGGTSMVVANLEYRVRAPGLGGLAQLAFFVDGGQVWTRGRESADLAVGALRWTPGAGVRVVTAFGAIRVDLGYNTYRPIAGPAYFDTPLLQGGELLCVSPGAVPGGACPDTYQPLRPASFWRRVTPSISIGQIF
jgi:outer membrane protein insertion porin family